MPHPLHVAFTAGVRFVEVTPDAIGTGDYGVGLKVVREDDVGIWRRRPDGR